MEQFQAAVFDRDGVRRLVETINQAAGKESRSESDIETIFNVCWPQFETAVRNIEPNIKLDKISIEFYMAKKAGNMFIHLNAM